MILLILEKYRISSIKNKIIERCDTSNFKAVQEIVTRHKPEYIFHTAALPLAKVSNLNNEEAKVSSVDSTVNIIDAVSNLNNRFKSYFVKDLFIFHQAWFTEILKNHLLVKIVKKILKILMEL